MTFALYRRPGCVVFLDDDPDYLEMLAEVMPPGWCVRLFLRPAQCIKVLIEESSRQNEDTWRHQDMVNRWREGSHLIPQILSYWRQDGMKRFGLTQVCMVDYAMPAMSGLQVLSELTDWSGSRVLLTGRVEEQLAVSAFNRGLIERFIPKQSPDIRLMLTRAIQDLLDRPNLRHEQTWRATLSREQNDLLCNSGISRALAELALREQWIEHVVLGAPFGVLALNREGGASWLQLETADKLEELAELSESQGWDPATVQDIRLGKTLIDIELQVGLGTSYKPQPRPAFSLGGDQTVLFAALFNLNESLSPGVVNSHEQFLALHSARTLQD
jgi:CheY-like chemotaxis protein